MNQEYLKIYQEGKLDISFYHFAVLVLINQQEHAVLAEIYDENFLEFKNVISDLESKGYIKWHGEGVEEISLRKKGEDLFSKIRKPDRANVQSWIDQCRNIFPEGVNNAGYRYRGSRLEVLKKMIKFVASNSYSKEEIFEATKRYVERFSFRGYAYMQQAHYFIDKKDTGSNLASECESLRETKSLQTVNTNYGGKVI